VCKNVHVLKAAGRTREWIHTRERNRDAAEMRTRTAVRQCCDAVNISLPCPSARRVLERERSIEREREREREIQVGKHNTFAGKHRVGDALRVACWFW
jgi:hypothetical protein